GETRVIRMGYGADELYTQWAIQSLALWQEFEQRSGLRLFHRTGVLWLGTEGDSYTESAFQVMTRSGVPCERLDQAEVRRRYPQLRFEDVTFAVLERESGLLMARRAVQAVVAEAVRNGVEYIQAAVQPPVPAGSSSGAGLAELKLSSGETLTAGAFIFACGPWLPKLFPQVLGGRIFPTRQEIFFLGPPASSDGFRPPKMPVWLHHSHPDIPYSLPDVEGRGFKLAFDRHGPAFDPDDGARVIGQESVAHLRAFLGRHIPELAQAPIVETRVCQYENTSNGDFLIDRHPEMENVWLVGGGSGHGFKHGPAVGVYVTGLVIESPRVAAEPRFSLATKQVRQERAVW
ncbi:MAG TPA: FAD-dependent oxidoreductase, partial [Candidatus Angelobacter sp.]|nr:FAD-dependent oxidoreductase [Candidatus Angelobacter sp.]